MNPDKPNIIFVLFDDLGYSDPGCYGGEIHTPSIDALARAGVRFEGMYNSARCCPSRASIMTGLYPPQAGIADFVTREPRPGMGPAHLGRLRDDCVTLAEVLKPAGYNCYYSGKWHMHAATDPVTRGFDEFYGFLMDYSRDQYRPDDYERLPLGRKKEFNPPAGEFYATDVFSDYALEFIRMGQRSGKPWMVYLGHSAPHFPLQAPKADVDRYYRTYLRGWDALRNERYRRMIRLGIVDPDTCRFTDRSMVPMDEDSISNGYAGKQNPAWDVLPTDRRKDLARRMAVYAAMVERADAGLGRICRHLRKTGELANTLIIITSDNGACYEWGPFGFDGESRTGVTHLHTGRELDSMGGPGTYHAYGSGWSNLCNTPFRMYKHFTYEGGVRAPLIIHWPRAIGRRSAVRGSFVQGSTHITDIMPTLREAAGAEYPATRNGQTIPAEEGMSLLPALAGKPLPARTLFFSHEQARAVLRDNWKAVFSKRTPTPPVWELYDISSDRTETRDLASEHPDIVQSLADEWEAYRKRVGLEPFVPWDVPAQERISD